MDRDHSDVIILKSLLFGHQNEALSQLFDDSWVRAHAFYKSYEQLKRAQLEAKVAAGQMSGSVGAILNAMEGLDVDMSPLLAEVCSSVSNFGGGEQLQLQDRLRCEEQHRLEHRLRQAQGELKQTRQSSISIQKFRLVVAVAVMLAFVVGAGVAFGVVTVFFGLGVGGEIQGACAAPGGVFVGVANSTSAPAGGEEKPMPPPSANLCEKAGSTVECLKFLLLLAPSPVVHVCVGMVVLSPMLFLAGIGKALKL
jgi:hypothetical protein